MCILKAMGKAARAIITKDDKILVMYRNKHGSEYFTLVGGRIHEDESIERGLVREVKEETGLEVTDARLVFTEEHPSPYNDQYMFLCKVGPYEDVKIQPYSEEGFMNKININVHKPVWVEKSSFHTLTFRTPQLQTAIIEAIKNGFPNQPIKL